MARGIAEAERRRSAERAERRALDRLFGQVRALRREGVSRADTAEALYRSDPGVVLDCLEGERSFGAALLSRHLAEEVDASERRARDRVGRLAGREGARAAPRGGGDPPPGRGRRVQRGRGDRRAPRSRLPRTGAQDVGQAGGGADAAARSEPEGAGARLGVPADRGARRGDAADVAGGSAVGHGGGGPLGARRGAGSEPVPRRPGLRRPRGDGAASSGLCRARRCETLTWFGRSTRPKARQQSTLGKGRNERDDRRLRAQRLG